MANAFWLRLLDTHNDGLKGGRDAGEGILDLHLVIEFCFAIYLSLSQCQNMYIYKQNIPYVNNTSSKAVKLFLCRKLYKYCRLKKLDSKCRVL